MAGASVVAIKGGRVSEEKQSEAQDTLRLIRDLADALTTQVERYRALSVQAGADEPAVKRIEALAARVDELKQHIVALTGPTEGDAAGAGGRVVPLKAERRGAARSNARTGRTEGVSDAAHTLAIEMKMEGHSRASVESTLQETFGLADASTIVNDVFSGTGSMPPP